MLSDNLVEFIEPIVSCAGAYASRAVDRRQTVIARSISVP